MNERIEELLNKEYWIIDILPKQVKKDSDGQYFSVIEYYLKNIKEIKRKHINLILKINCYYDICIEDKVNPEIEDIVNTINNKYVFIMINNSMILSEADDTHMTLFNPDNELLEMVKYIANSEGLFVWKP